MRFNPTMKYFFWAARRSDGKPLTNIFSIDREYTVKNNKRIPVPSNNEFLSRIEDALEVNLNWTEKINYPPDFMRDEYIQEVMIAMPSVVGNPNVVVVIISDNTPLTKEIIRSIRYGW